MRPRRTQSARGCRRAERGATLVEFALVVLVFLTMVLGIVDFSRALYTYHFLSNAARQATRWSAVNGNTCANDTSSTDTGGSCNGMAGMNIGPASATDIQNYVSNHVPMGINAGAIQTTVHWPVQTGTPLYCDPAQKSYYVAQNEPGCTVEVTVTYPFNFLYPLVHSGAITMSSTSEMVIAH